MMDFKNLSTQDIIYLVISLVLIVSVLFGIFLMSKVKKSRIGNGLSALSMLLAIILVLIYSKVFDFSNDSFILGLIIIFGSLIIGSVIGIILSKKVKMIEMPQLVALLNGFGGAASALVGIVSFILSGKAPAFGNDIFTLITASLAIAVGLITLFGSLVAAGKLHRVLPQKAIVLRGHQVLLISLLSIILLDIIVPSILIPLNVIGANYAFIFLLINILASILFGIIFSIRVGGADMPITISLLNSLSGVAGSIAGLALHDILLVAIGGIVGASGLILTQIMCKAINRSLLDILFGKAKATQKPVVEDKKPVELKQVKESSDDLEALRKAKDVIIVPGYGMAIAQAQHLVKKLQDYLVKNGAKVRYAIHPVAGRMPGHMNVLLCEADVDYEDLFEMNDINEDFKSCDAVIVVGANDVLNPAANTAVNTPIYGMPVLKVADAKEIYIFNYDTKPGYAGVDNPLYERENGVHIYLGNAFDTLSKVLEDLNK
ncbi:MAG: NAD(P)(+) transhydrogenase (Re/Si-specific) subunit beta [Bacilli bacterium]|nr:NAD(P)(+) transhydrogenase (Re/Si-specific) subunit beta [Bacilli bacterium]